MICPPLLVLPLLQLCLSEGLIEPRVRTSRGEVVGLTVDHLQTTGAQFRAFIGIPYAELPSRFQLAKPKKCWDRPLTAQKDGPPCPQPTRLPWSEDCLYINVYTPQDATPINKLPVMVYIHGSAFTTSSSFSRKYGPDFLISQGVILVTFNYRLGVPGFLTMGLKDAPGNMGLHDTTLALQWVQQEISQFGGSPTQVTLFGQSAGAVVTLFHYISTASIGLFQRAIAQSGSEMAEWAHYTRAEGTRRARLLARAVGCDVTQGDINVLACLQSVDIHTLINNTYTNLDDGQYSVPGLALPFLPVMDDSSWSDSPFFDDSLQNLMRKATERSIPLIIGFNTQEGIFFIDKSEKWKQVEAKLTGFIPQSVRSGLTEEKLTCLTKEIKKHYFPESPSDNKVEDIVNLYTDSLFAFPAVQNSYYFKESTYTYVFGYDGSWRITNSYFSQFNLPGVSHGDELPYMFVGLGNQTFENSEENNPNLKVKDFMVKLWTSFAKTGIPSCNWETVSNGNYLLIDSTPSILPLRKLEAKHYNFWATLGDRASSSFCTPC